MKNNMFALLATVSLAGFLNVPALANDWHHDADLNNDGHLNYHEWEEWNRHHPGVPKREWHHRFAALDHDHDGFLSPEEVRDLHY